MNIFNKIFFIYNDEYYFKITIFFLQITIKKKIKILENELNIKNNIINKIPEEIYEYVKNNRNILKKNDIVFIDTNVDISKYLLKYFPNSKYIRIDIWFDLSNVSIEDLIYILNSKIIVTSSESSFFKYLFEDQIIINIWHACGAFKKFGRDGLKGIYNKKDFIYTFAGYNNICQSKNNYMITSSKNVNKFYSNAFQLELDNIYSLGQIRTDILFDKEHIKYLKNSFYEKNPNLIDKKIYLYVPTYRNDGILNNSFFYFDLKKLSRNLNEKEIFIYKLHPSIIKLINNIGERNIGRITNLTQISNNILDFSNEDILTLLIIADVIITDYSSAFMEGLLLNKPVVFTANDIDKYENGFYLDYRNDLPGEIVESKNVFELINALRNANINHPNYEKFKEFHLGGCDGNSCKRVADFINTFVH